MSSFHTAGDPAAGRTKAPSSIPAESRPRAALTGKTRLVDKLGIDDASLARRREFVRLGDAERATPDRSHSVVRESS